MASSSDHLALMNSVLSLAYNLESYPNHLFTAGYKIERIEPIFKIEDRTAKGELKLNPDIFFMSEDMGLLAECKGGSEKFGKNLNNYVKISTKHLMEKGISIPKDDFELDIAIFGNNNINSINRMLSKDGLNYPQIQIYECLEQKYGRDFVDTNLKDLFQRPINIKNKPLLILKFDGNSNYEEIAPFVFNTLMSRLVNREVRFTTRDFTEDVIGEIWDSFDREFQKSLINKVKYILNYCKVQRDFKKYLQKDGDIWTIKVKDHWRSKMAFNKNCEKVRRKLKQKQSTLTDFNPKKSRIVR